MLETLSVTRMAEQLAAHAGARLGLIARNVAQADTPGYKAVDLESFAETYRDSGAEGMRGVFPAAMFPGGEVDFLKAPAAQAPTKGRSLDHIGFEVKDIEALCKKLEAAGVTFDLTLRTLPALGGLKIAYVLDPEGTRIELTEGFMGK